MRTLKLFHSKRTKTAPRWKPAAALLAVLATAACGNAPAQAQETHPHPQARPAQNEADVRFVAGMIPHHAQALEMVELVPSRSSREDVKRMAQRIQVSQRDEIRLMERWLESHGVAGADSAHAHHGGARARMPGMLTPEEMQALAAASGPEFDRLFLEGMIRHHEGALTMVAELFNTPGGGQESDVFRIASEVDADQRMEIDRMRTMLQGPLGGSPPR